MHEKYTIANTRHGLAADSLADWLCAFEFEPRSFGHQQGDPQATCQSRVIGDFEIICNIGGESHIIFGQENLILHAGEGVLIPPFTPHAIWTPPEDPHHNYWLHFDVGPAWLHPSFLKAVQPICCKRIKLQQPTEWRAIFTALEKEIQAGKPGVQIMFQAALLQIITCLFRETGMGDALTQEAEPDQTADKSRFVRRELVRKCTEIVLSDLSAPHPVAALAEGLHVSISVLQKAFTTEMGLPLHQFILLARVRQAEAYMLTTEMTLEEIAADVGLSTGHHLNSAFKRFYQMSPREWIRLRCRPNPLDKQKLDRS